MQFPRNILSICCYSPNDLDGTSVQSLAKPNLMEIHKTFSQGHNHLNGFHGVRQRIHRPTKMNLFNKS